MLFSQVFNKITSTTRSYSAKLYSLSTMPENGLYIWTRDVRAGTGNLNNQYNVNLWSVLWFVTQF